MIETKGGTVDRKLMRVKEIVGFVAPIGLGLISTSCSLVKLFEQGKTPTPLSPTETNKSTATPQPTETLIPCDVSLFNRFAADIVSTNPGLNQEQIVTQLNNIANNVPSELPFDSEACRGLIANPAPAHVENSSGDAMEANAPEGGFFYGSTGHERITVNGQEYDHPWQENNVYLTFVVGEPDNTIEGIGNTHFTIDQFPVGHYFAALASPDRNQNIQNRQVIEKTWFAQQLWWATRSGTNCGIGCGTVTLSFIDTKTNTQTQWKVTITDFNTMALKWEKVN